MLQVLRFCSFRASLLGESISAVSEGGTLAPAVCDGARAHIEKQGSRDSLKPQDFAAKRERLIDLVTSTEAGMALEANAAKQSDVLGPNNATADGIAEPSVSSESADLGAPQQTTAPPDDASDVNAAAAAPTPSEELGAGNDGASAFAANGDDGVTGAAEGDAAATGEAPQASPEGADEGIDTGAGADDGASKGGVSDEELQDVLRMADDTGSGGGKVNFVKLPSIASRDSTVRPQSPPPPMTQIEAARQARQNHQFIEAVLPAKLQKCEPSTILGGREKQCEHVVNTKSCSGNIINYLKFVYCNPLGIWLPITIISLALILMLYILALVADTFFCPALETVATLLRLSPEVAGATLLALGNGAPDIFSQVAAVTSGDLPDVNMAVSSALGSGLFITTVILGCVILTSAAKVEVTPVAYNRDVLAYLAGVMIIGGILMGGTVRRRCKLTSA